VDLGEFLGYDRRLALCISVYIVGLDLFIICLLSARWLTRERTGYFTFCDSLDFTGP
jgi:hypothetical protein